jgi:hypothetical protein
MQRCRGGEEWRREHGEGSMPGSRAKPSRKGAKTQRFGQKIVFPNRVRTDSVGKVRAGTTNTTNTTNTINRCSGRDVYATSLPPELCLPTESARSRLVQLPGPFSIPHSHVKINGLYTLSCPLPDGRGSSVCPIHVFSCHHVRDSA